MKTTLTLIAALCLGAATLTARAPQPRPLYPAAAPGDNGLAPSATTDNGEVRFGISVPDYTLYLPDEAKATGQLVVVCPGGGYGCVCYAREGNEVAEWLSDNGIAAAVLRYRMPNGHHDIPLQDVRQMIRIARDSASRWHIDPAQVGIMGFSAGGHLAATASTLLEDAARPDFAILLYPVISMTDSPFTDKGTRANLLGAAFDAELAERFSPERHVTSETPPTFIALSDDDEMVHPRNSTLYYDALRDAGVMSEMHIYPTGHHGWIGNFTYWDEYHGTLLRWLGQLREGIVK